MAQQRDRDRLLLGGEGRPGRRQPVGNQASLGGQELLTAFGEREDAAASIVLGRDATQQSGRLQPGRLLGHGGLAQQRVRRDGRDALAAAGLHGIEEH